MCRLTLLLEYVFNVHVNQKIVLQSHDDFYVTRIMNTINGAQIKILVRAMLGKDPANNFAKYNVTLLKRM